MKVTVARDSLASALRKVLSVVSNRTTLPVLSNVLLEAADGKLSLTGTDLEVSIRTELPVTVVTPGSITLLAKKFGQIVNSLPAGEVTLETGENQITSISCKRSFFKVIGLDGAEFPRDNAVQSGWSFTSTAAEFKKILGKVSYAASPDETRQVLNGILLSLRAGILTTAATDSRRLALVEKPLAGENPGEGDVILPPKVVGEIQKIFEGEDGLTVQLSEKRVAFKTADTIVMSRLVEGNYPNYRQVVPTNFARTLVIPREEFISVLNRVSMVISETSGAVKLKVEGTQMVVSASSTEFGESNEPMDVSYEGNPVNLSFNPGFLMDPLKHLECDRIVLQFNDEYSPVSLSGDEGFLYILMPMRS